MVRQGGGPSETRARAAPGLPTGADIAPCLLDGFQKLMRAEAVVVEATGRLLSRLFDRNGHEKLGYTSFGDMARERLLISPRSADDHRTLYRVLSDRPGVREAFLAGRITACQVLALRTVFTDENEAFWLERCRTLGVRDLKRLVREMRRAERGASPDGAGSGASPAADGGPPVMSADPEEEAEFTTISFDAPPSVVLAWDDALELSRRMLGWNAPRYECVEAILAEAAPGDGVEEEAMVGFRPDVEGAAGGSRPDHGAGAGRVAEREGAVAGETGATRRPNVCHRRGADAPGPGRRAPWPPTTPSPRGALGSARETLLLIRRELEDIEALIDVSVAADPEDLLDRIHALQIIGRPLRILLGRLLHDLVATGALRRLGYRNLEDFAGEHLHLSRATAFNLLNEARLFFDNRVLAEAYATRRIGVGQAILIEGVARADVDPAGTGRVKLIERMVEGDRHPASARPCQERLLTAYVARAATVTHRQFWREVRFREKLTDFFPALSMQLPGPFPVRDLEPALIESLSEHGWTRKDVKALLNARGLYRALSRANDDPAANPVAMRRMETLLNLLVLTAFDDALELSGEPMSRVQMPGAGGPSGVQTFASGAPTSAGRGAEGPSAVQTLAIGESTPGGGSAEGQPEVQTFAIADVSVVREDFPRPGGKTLARSTPMTALRFRCPLYLKQWWRKAIEEVRKERWMPAWACVTLIIRKATGEWLKTDPERTPSELMILERDGYLCQAPGCGRRRGLEVHHIVFRSRGGGDEESNRVVLCSAHHRALLHGMGSIRVTGQAPHDLTWRVGGRTYQGEKLAAASLAGPSG